MRDFASYEGEEPKDTQAWMDEANAVAAQYAGKGENEILRAIYARAVEGKKNGTLTNEQIDEFYAHFSSMLDGAKKKRLKKLVEELKRM